jgi:hypothetical protein
LDAIGCAAPFNGGSTPLAAAGTPLRSEQRGGFTGPGGELPIHSHSVRDVDADSADDAIVRVQETLKTFGSFGDFLS